MIQRMVRGPLLALTLLFALPSLVMAQWGLRPDSVLAVSRGGRSLLRVNIDGSAVFGGQWDGGTSSDFFPAYGAGTRMMWIPSKAALRAGYINGGHWDEHNVGYFSLAVGENVRAYGDHSVALGLRSTASGPASFAVGEDNTASGIGSVAMGTYAHTNARHGSFVFSDRSSVDSLRAGVNHSASWRVSGGFRIFTSSDLTTGVTIHSGALRSNWDQSSAVISTSTGAMLTTSGVWQNSSDVNRKHLFADVSGEEVLERLRELPIRSWSYLVDGDRVRHLGPTAQDFYAAFGLGSDDTSIGTVDADGVALVGVQALEARTRELRDENSSLKSELTSLRAEIELLRQQQAEQEARLRRLEATVKP